MRRRTPNRPRNSVRSSGNIRRVRPSTCRNNFRTAPSAVTRSTQPAPPTAHRFCKCIDGNLRVRTLVSNRTVSLLRPDHDARRKAQDVPGAGRKHRFVEIIEIEIGETVGAAE